MQDKDIILLVTVSTITFLVFNGGIVLLLFLFFKTKQKHILEKQQSQLNFIQELNKTKLEIHDQTLVYVGRELHDNLGQLLTVAKINSLSLVKQFPELKKVIELDAVLDKIMGEFKDLSKSLNNSRIRDFGLLQELSIALERIEKLNVIEIIFSVIGQERDLPADKAIMLYRIIQEFLSNTLKYSQANKIQIDLGYFDERIQVHLADNGIGFDMNSERLGSGITNIKHRAHLLNARVFEFTSNAKEGTQLFITLPIE